MGEKKRKSDHFPFPDHDLALKELSYDPCYSRIPAEDRKPITEKAWARGEAAARETFQQFHGSYDFFAICRESGLTLKEKNIDFVSGNQRYFSDYISGKKEVNLYLRGMVPMVGFKSTCVAYDRHERIAGKSHYPLSKMLGLAFDGITSLSVKPIRLITLFGLLVSLISFIGIIWVLITALTGHSVAGWASNVCIVCFMGGIQSMFLGVIGEYIGKIYLETKARPRYIISERTEEMEETHDASGD